ncbi:unnamed protein product [Rotaria magnacalcarata]|uniref:Uncharacterized protein n=1 Tax=Rotaria magnacalcarata TaxID=392030 RepID=A0A819I1G4_9BILA|nr:unnamed protein product [Rotaria magnacalcarata]CAF3906659.1 unnamed protein product [Rotaria magnacalcarata]
MSFPPSNSDRFVSQTDFSMDEINDIEERTQIQQNLTTNNISTMMPPSTLMKNMEEKSTVSTSAVKENIEPLPTVAQHELGPIQRPNKLSCVPTKQSSVFTDSIESPNTPDVLVQINHLLDRQNSISIISSTSKVPIITNSSTSINEISTPNVSWTPYSPIEWSSKYDSSWPESSNISLARQQISSEEALIWPSNKDTQRSTQWNEPMSPAAVPSQTEIARPTKTNSWLTFLPVPDPTSDDVNASDGQENEINNPFSNSNETQENSSASWWPKVSSSEKNDDDTDRSRWDFAR